MPIDKKQYINPTLPTSIEKLGLLKQRILLLGDAGLSSLNPLQASLQKTIERAKKSPKRTSIIMLGDNIYPKGFPSKQSGQTNFTMEQLEDISHLEAQLQIAKQSNAEIFIVPGNHDWYATHVDSQAQFIDDYAKQHKTNTDFVPFTKNAEPYPEMIYRNGISIVFIDSMWLLEADNNTFVQAMQQLELLLKKSYLQFPDNVILLAAHHPLETMGPHGGYYSQLGLQIYEGVLELFNGENVQDLNSRNYQRLIKGIKSTVSPYNKTVFAAGHDHSLQLFKSHNDNAPQYSLVSGAANESKLTSVGFNENTQFSSSQEGFVEIDILDNGVVLKIYTIESTQPAHQQWLFH